MITRADQLLPRRPLRLPAAIALVVGATLLALAPGLASATPVGDRLAFTPFVLSSAVATFYLGWRWGLGAAIAGCLLGLWLLGVPTHGLAASATDLWSLVVYVLMAAIVVGALQLARWALVHLRNERRVAEQLEMVSQELSHRIQNIFAITTSLARLSVADYPEARPYADSLLAQLAALGRAHNFIRPHSASSAPEGGAATLNALLATLFAPYQGDGVTRMKVQGDDVAVGPQAATPLALLFHELATNSIKYGALSAPAGQVLVTSVRAGEMLHVTWAESGGPVVTGPPARVGFGSRLARMSVEKQLRGGLAHDWSPQGLAVSLTLPLSSLI